MVTREKIKRTADRREKLKAEFDAEFDAANREKYPATTEKIWKLADRLSDQWFRAQTKNPFEAYYIYYAPSEFETKQFGNAYVISAETRPDSLELGDPQRIGPNISLEQARTRIAEILQRLPILPIR